jgi:Protein of unknown function (DUF4038)/Putative collagen-binding domain of a collagenase
MRLKISKNQRFLAYEDDKPFFYLGDTAWELFHRLNREEAELYLKDRAAKGFTVIQAVVLAELDGLHTPNPYGHTPLQDNDPTKPNDAYFQHVDSVVSKAESLGLFIAMLPTWGDKWNLKWGKGPEIFTPENARSYGKWLARRYAEKPVLWVLGGDRPPETDEHKVIIRAMAEGIRASVGKTQLISYHTYGGSSSANYFHDEPWLDFNMYQTGHKRDQESWLSIGKDYARTPVKPCMDAEPGYENIPNDLKDASVRLYAHHCRKFLYGALFAGAHGHTYGCNDIWQMWSPGKSSVIHANLPWSEAIHLPGSGQMRFAKDLLLSRPFFTRVPAPSLIVSETHSGGNYICATRDSGGSYALVHSAAGLPFTVELSPLRGPLHAAWFDPRTGASTPLGTIKATGEKEFSPPTQGETQDWVLTLDRSKG